ncbi:PARP domain containing protein [Asbolus verrucosus]|uniref:Poly [ADP-ribose] polymerase n=1 Tax=Asbolus verrucosus TaxID=1661398 RepID=A0A482VIU8_ASBVE|nr:PARP domain containing protein [Asbolus verrucosus]
MSRHRRDDICTRFQGLSLRDQPSTSRGCSSRATTSGRKAPVIQSVKNPHVLDINHSGGKVVTCQNLHPTDHMYKKIEDLITNETFVIENIVEVHNPFLKKAYDLKKSQKKRQFGEVHECLVFHGTKKANVNSICTYNFNWRLFGTNKGHKFGKGVSFSTNAKYASNYSDLDLYHKVLIVAKVLITNVCQGHPNMTYPPPGYDTSQKGGSGIVIVKYDDNEFYPAYKLYYHLDDDESDNGNYYDNNNLNDDYDYDNDYYDYY